jgi:hypothetical protein
MPLIVDVPKYWTRWLAEEASDRTYLGLVQGAIDAATRWRADRDWAVWRGESTWMTLHISVAVCEPGAGAAAASVLRAARRSHAQRRCIEQRRSLIGGAGVCQEAHG